MRNSIGIIAAMMAATGLSASTGGAVGIHRGFGERMAPKLDPRASGDRKGRRFTSPSRNGVNPAGTKLSKKAIRGSIGINGLR